MGLGLSAVVSSSCGNSDSKRKTPADYRSAGAGGEGGEALADEGGGPALSPSAAGAAGSSDEKGGGGAAGADGSEMAQAGAGGRAEPLVETIVSADVNLSTDSLTAGRSCAEAVAYSVIALSGSTATLTGAPDSDCLAVDDEVLLVNLQGTATEHNNVGRWELLHVAELAGPKITFERSVARIYGSGVSNAGLGVTADDQRVALVRVPRFGRLVIEQGVTLTAQAWDGVLGGVVALRATKLELAGTISVAALGYRGGRWSEDDYTCYHSTQTEAGESIGGLGTATTLRNLGASGGIGPAVTSFNADNAVVATPAHSQAGEPGFNPKGRTIGEPGLAYGAPDATTLTMGSGPGGALSCTFAPIETTPYLFVGTTGQGGGIAVLLVDDLQVQPTGAINATPPDAERDVAFAGGYVFLHGSKLDLGDGQVTALGSTGNRPQGPFMGQSNHGSPGYIVVSAPNVTGTTNPPALSAATIPAPGL